MSSFIYSSWGTLTRVNSIMKRECIGGKCLMLDAEEGREKFDKEENLSRASS